MVSVCDYETNSVTILIRQNPHIDLQTNDVVKMIKRPKRPEAIFQLLGKIILHVSVEDHLKKLMEKE